MLAAVRFHVASDDRDAFLDRARTAVRILAACRGFVSASIGSATDDPGVWVLVSRWDGVGDYRRALSSYDVKVHVHPLLYEAVDEPSAFEELLVVDHRGVVVETGTDRAADAAVAGPGAQ